VAAMAQGPLRQGGDDERSGLGAPTEGMGELSLQSKDSTLKKRPMKRLTSFLAAAHLALSLAGAVLADQP
jgi:hypothetical protein